MLLQTKSDRRSAIRGTVVSSTKGRKAKPAPLDSEIVGTVVSSTEDNKPKSFTQTVKFPFTDQQDKIYFNVGIAFDDQEELQYKIASFNQVFNQPIVPKASDYYCAITRFQLPVNLIPMFIPVFDPADGAPTTIYTVNMKFTTNSSGPVNITYTPQNNITSPDGLGFYDFIYSYQDFLNDINVAIVTAFDDISAPGDALPPYFQFNEQTGVFSLVAQEKYYNNKTAGANLITLSVNDALYSLLQGFPGKATYTNNSKQSLNPELDSFQFNIFSQGSNWYNPPEFATTIPPLYLIMTQNYPTLPAWSPFSAIRITSNSLPIKQEQIISENNGVLASVGVLQTFFPEFSESETHGTYIYYAAQGNYHLLNMSTDNPISQLQFDVNWVDTAGNVRPILLGPNTALTVEFMFVKKSTFTS